MHGILPCNLNLWRWRIKSNNLCDVCLDIQSIQHLLFDCKYVKQLWQLLGTVFNTTIDYDVILGLKNQTISFIVTLVSFCVYKEWLLCSLDGKSRKQCMNWSFYRSELLLRLDIYNKCNNVSILEITQLEQLIKRLI